MEEPNARPHLILTPFPELRDVLVWNAVYGKNPIVASGHKLTKPATPFEVEAHQIHVESSLRCNSSFNCYTASPQDSLKTFGSIIFRR